MSPYKSRSSQKNKSIWMNKLTLSKIKMKNRPYHRLLKTKDQHDYQMYAKYRNQSKTLAEKQLQIIENICRERWNLTQKHFSDFKHFSELPQDWKDAIITPLHKKGEKEFASNDRPISLISIVCKVMESIIKDDILAS